MNSVLRQSIKMGMGLSLGLLPFPEHPTFGEQGLHLRWRLGWIKGWLLRPYWKLCAHFGGTRLQIGKRFSLQGQLKLSGPGTVILGDDVIMDAVCTPFTHSRTAVIQIGSCCFVNGTRFGCSERIDIGDECILADARIMDTDFHAVHRNRNLPGMRPEVAPIRIGRNVWIAAGSAVLKGITIGSHSVIAFGSVVTRDVPEGRIYGGNPARDLGEVPLS
ncbi:MAG: acyltransferase [Methylotenera sp.]|nr:acyltransferase [Oligoflexia bacterium]